jgi:hypothetical protein
MNEIKNNKKGIQARFVLLLSLAFFMFSCEKQVNLNLSTSGPVLVVNGQIETNMPPIVVLSTSLGFFNTVDLNTLQNSFVHNAIVQVSDGSQTVTLKEYAFDTGTNAKYYIYTVDSNLMLGQIGKYYTLSIKYNNTSYTAVSKLPNPKNVDSFWAAPVQNPGKTLRPDAMSLYVNYTDPDTPGNYVKYFTKLNRDIYYPVDNVFNDEVINGHKVPNINISLGYNNVTNANTDSLRHVYPGDTVVLKWCMIDRGVYNFWNTYNFAIRAVGNPFSSPINVISNINNGALGYWAAYGTAFDTLIVK